METSLAPCFLYFGRHFFSVIHWQVFPRRFSRCFCWLRDRQGHNALSPPSRPGSAGHRLEDSQQIKVGLLWSNGLWEELPLQCLDMSCSGKVFGMKKEQLLSAVGWDMLSQLSHCGILRASGYMRQLSLLG